MALYQKYKTRGVVFKEENDLGADKIFSIFTKEFGRVEVLGRAIRKIDSKLKGGIEIFSLSEIEFIQGKNKKTLTDAVFKEKFKNLFENQEKLKVACEISQLIDNFIKGQEPDEKIWNLLVDSFEKLNQYQSRAEHCQLVYAYFFWNLVSVLGYSPELSNCADCQQKLNPYELYFSNKEGGVICKNCHVLKRSGTRVNSDIIKILRLFLNKDWNILKGLKIKTNSQNLLGDVSNSYCNYLLQKNLAKN